jgi:hypothetical protein
MISYSCLALVAADRIAAKVEGNSNSSLKAGTMNEITGQVRRGAQDRQSPLAQRSGVRSPD